MFQLDPQLEKDTFFVRDLTLCRVLLAKNATWPWLILVPRRENVSELVELSAVDQAELLREIDQACHTLKKLATPDKLNVAAIGNVVRQLHIHVVARRVGDPGWPKPVWGLDHHADYGARQKDELVQWVHDDLLHNRT